MPHIELTRVLDQHNGFTLAVLGHGRDAKFVEGTGLEAHYFDGKVLRDGLFVI